jgi:hypothetical protein
MVPSPLANQRQYTITFRMGAKRAKDPANQISVNLPLDQSHEGLHALIIAGGRDGARIRSVALSGLGAVCSSAIRSVLSPRFLVKNVPEHLSQASFGWTPRDGAHSTPCRRHCIIACLRACLSFTGGLRSPTRSLNSRAAPTDETRAHFPAPFVCVDNLQPILRRISLLDLTRRGTLQTLPRAMNCVAPREVVLGRRFSESDTEPEFAAQPRVAPRTVFSAPFGAKLGATWTAPRQRCDIWIS